MAQLGYFILNFSYLERELNDEILRLMARPETDDPNQDQHGSTQADEGEPWVQGTLEKRLSKWTELVRCSQQDSHIHSKAEQLEKEVNRLRKHRNLIVHGLLGGKAKPETGDPHISCREGGHSNPAGQERIYTLTELKKLTDSVERCQIGFSTLYRWRPDPDGQGW